MSFGRSFGRNRGAGNRDENEVQLQDFYDLQSPSSPDNWGNFDAIGAMLAADSRHSRGGGNDHLPTSSRHSRARFEGRFRTAPFGLNVSDSSFVQRTFEGNNKSTAFKKQFVENISSLRADGWSSDVTLIVAGKRFPSHRLILSARNPYFRKMFYGNMREAKEKEVTLVDPLGQPWSIVAFQAFFDFLYNGEICLKAMEKQGLHHILALLNIVHMYESLELEVAILEHLERILSITNIYTIYNATCTNPAFEGFAISCVKFIGQNAYDIFSKKDSNFLEFTACELTRLVEMVRKAGSELLTEVNVFHMVRYWIEANQDKMETHPALLALVDLPQIDINSLLNIIEPTKLYTAEALLSAVKKQHNKSQGENCLLVELDDEWS